MVTLRLRVDLKNKVQETLWLRWPVVMYQPMEEFRFVCRTNENR